MATIKIKRRTTGVAGAPSSLASGELAFNETGTDLNLYYGAGDNGSGIATSIAIIAGFGSVFDTKVRAYRLDQFAAPTSPFSIIDGTLASHAASLGQLNEAVRLAAAGIDSKPSVRAVATANITLSGTQTVDGVSLAVGDRVLAAGQTTGSQNGPYIVASGAWSRGTDADQTGELTPGAEWYVEEGAAFAKTKWKLVNTGAITLGTTAITLTQSEAASVITAGNGTAWSDAAKTNITVLADPVSGGGITVSSAGVRISATYAGQTSITTLGTIATGTWNGSVIAPAYGGTGLSAVVNGLLKGNGTAYSAAVAGTDYLTPAYAGSANIVTVGTVTAGTWQATTIAGAYGGLGVALSTITDGALLKRSGANVAAASAGTDYLAPNSTIDGGTF